MARDRKATTVEQLGNEALDVRELKRAGLLKDRRLILGSSVRWPSISKMIIDKYAVQLEFPHRTVSQRIRISWTRCHLGGARPWLHCSCCERRVAKLFNGFAGYFCRACVGNPMYACQTKSTKGRRHFEACKLRLRLGGYASLAKPLPERPKGMHRTIFIRLQRKLEDLEAGLSQRLKAKPPDYRNLVYYAPPMISKSI